MKKTIEVVGAIILKDKKVFCTQRGGEKALPYKWEFPGGKIESGESPENALMREIFEELHSVISIKGFFQTVAYEYDTFIIHLHTYLCELVEGNLELTEHVDKKWANIDDLSSLDFAPADKPIISSLLKYLK